MYFLDFLKCISLIFKSIFLSDADDRQTVGLLLTNCLFAGQSIQLCYWAAFAQTISSQKIIIHFLLLFIPLKNIFHCTDDVCEVVIICRSISCFCPDLAKYQCWTPFVYISPINRDVIYRTRSAGSNISQYIGKTRETWILIIHVHSVAACNLQHITLIHSALHIIPQQRSGERKFPASPFTFTFCF